MYLFFFFFNDTATTEIYTLSLHDALPICLAVRTRRWSSPRLRTVTIAASLTIPMYRTIRIVRDRKSTRLNSSHSQISYAVFCLKKKKKQHRTTRPFSPDTIPRSHTNVPVP